MTPHTATSRLLSLLALVLFVSIALPASAQDETPKAVTNQNRTGDLPFSTSIGTDVESVDVSTGSLSVRIPFTSVKGRGMDFSFGLRWMASFWSVATRGSGSTTYQKWNLEKRNWLPDSTGLGWEPNQPRVTHTSYHEGCGGTNFYVQHSDSYIYSDSDGGKHGLELEWQNGRCQWPAGSGIDQGGYTSQTLVGPDSSGAGIWATISFASFGPPSIRLADGTSVGTVGTQTSDIEGPFLYNYQQLYGSFIDSNGNKKSEYAAGLDTLGRALVTQQNGTNQILYKVYDSNGVQQTYTANFVNISISTNFGMTGVYGPVQELGGTRKAISSIVLPNGRAYSFQYENNSYGGLTRIDLPGGAYITYTWGTCYNGLETHRYVTSRTVNVDGQSYTWNLSLVCTGATATATVTDPLGNQSVYASAGGNVTSAKLYQGTAAGTPLRQYALDYYWMGGYRGTDSGGLPTRITTTLENGLVSKKEFDYEVFNYDYETCWDGLQCAINEQMLGDGTDHGSGETSRGNVKEIREYDWGSGAPGALVRRTTKDYLHTNNTNYLTRNIVSKIIAETIYDGSSPTATTCTVANGCKARSEFEYDSTAITATSAAPQHDYTGYPSTFTYRGNATKVKKWRNTDGALLTTSYIYDDLGNIRSITDPGLHTTTWDYTDNWSGSGCLPPANSLAYVKQVTNHLGHRIQLSRFPCTGLVQTRKDENDLLAARPGTTFTYDLFGRLLTKLETDGLGQTTNAYNDVPPVSVTTTTKITSTLNLVSTAIQDGLGRVKQTQLTSDPEGTVNTDTTYDALGRTATVTNPYRSISDPTYGVTTTEYDALGRATKVIPPDGSATANNVTTIYAGTTTTVTDQAGKSRKSESDALARLIRVWEPNGAGATSPATPGTGTVTINGVEEFVDVENCLEVPPFTCTTTTTWDTGNVQVTVGGFSRSVNYGQTSTAASLASSLASAFNAAPTSPVTAAVSGATITLTSKQTGATTNYSLSTSSTSNRPDLFAAPSFTATPSGPTLTGGADAAVGGFTNPYLTRYFYDTLDNLTCVLQLSTDAEPASCTAPSATWRPRTFTYNSLSQLLTAVNPESGAITYTYDSDGNVLTKVAPKPNQTGALTVSTTYSYDALHRLAQKSYNDGATALVKYGYDAVALAGCTTAPPTLTITNGAGRRTAMCDASGATSWSYDPEGATLTEKRTIVGSSAITNTVSYTYNLDGSLATLVYPSGRTITYAPSGAGRTLSAIDTANSINYASSALYAPHGALSSLKNGYVSGGFAGITTTNSYSNRLQPVLLSAAAPSGTILSFSYSFDQDPSPSVVKNNGNVVQIANNLDTTRTQSFTYDELNRVAYAWSSGNLWGNQFVYDIWANLNKKLACPAGSPCQGKPQGENLDQTAGTKNQFAGFCYDAAGNLNGQSLCPVLTYTYDAENRLTTTAGITYVYDGDGKRVKKSNGKLYWTGTGSDALAETDLAGVIQSEFAFFNGKRVARRDGAGNTVFYYFSDHLGSASVVTNATGTIVEESDYYPFGGERIITNSDPNPYKFTGKERDTESGLDYLIARHYSSNLGRFLQPDEFKGGPVDAFSSSDPAPPGSLPYADITNPQSLNKYTYTYNSPLRYTDPNGHDGWDFLLGAANAFGSNFFAGAMRLEGGNSDLKNGQALGDAASVVGGAVETALGGGLEVGGLALDATGVGAVIGVPANAVGAVAISQGLTAVGSGTYHLAKSVSNPFGSKGKPDHQEAVEKVVDKAKAEAKPGEKVLREQKVQGRDLNRKPDSQIVGTNGKTRKAFEAERRPNSQYHREREADYKRCGIECKTEKVGK